MKSLKTNIPKLVSGIVLVALLTFTFGANVFTTFAAVNTGDASSKPIATSPNASYVPIATATNAPEEIAQAAVTNITTAAPGTTVSASIPANTLVSSDVFKAAKGKDVKVKISSFAGVGVSWTFSGITNEVYFDPTVNVGKDVEAVNYAANKANLPADKFTTVSFAYHGALPGTAEVSIDLTGAGKFTWGQAVYLYYYNPETGLFEFVDDSVYEGYTKFTMTHCSEYIVTSEKLTANVSTKTTSPKTGEVANVALYSLIGLAAIAFVVTSKKK